MVAWLFVASTALLVPQHAMRAHVRMEISSSAEATAAKLQEFYVEHHTDPDTIDADGGVGQPSEAVAEVHVPQAAM